MTSNRDPCFYLAVLSVISTLCDNHISADIHESKYNGTRKQDYEAYQLDFRDGFTLTEDAPTSHDVASYVDNVDNVNKISSRSVPFTKHVKQDKTVVNERPQQNKADATSEAVNRQYFNNIFLYNLLMSKTFIKPMGLHDNYFGFHKNRRLSYYDLFKRSEQEGIVDESNADLDVTESFGEDTLHDQNVISKRPSRRRRPLPPASCNMDEIDMFIRFREHLDTDAGTLLLVCEGRIRVNKCEGQCDSKVSPDVNKFDGFNRECSCCKDSSSISREVTLTTCTLGTLEVFGYSLSRTVVEPSACACLACSRH